MYEKNPLSKLRSQLIFTFLLGSMGIVLAIGLPVVLLIDRQATSQTNLLLEQAVLTTQASLAREQSDLQNLALLIAQRPTLHQLLEERNPSALDHYLDTLRDSIHLDLLIICDTNHQAVGASTNTNAAGLCAMDNVSGFLPGSLDRDSMLFTTSDIREISSSSYKVILGKDSSAILSQLQEETGLAYLLMRNDQVVASSDPLMDTGFLPPQEIPTQNTSDTTNIAKKWVPASDGKSYLLSNIIVNSNRDLNLIGALNVDEQVQTQKNVSQSLILGLILVVLVAFGLGIWLSQRISSPLNHLANVAAEFRHGNLHSPVSIQTSTSEISQLANTLEDARVALEHSMNQLQSEKAWVEHILNSIVEGILTMDNQNRITFASEGISRIAEQEIEPVIGQKVDQLFLPVEGEIFFSEQLPAMGQQQSISAKLKNGKEKLLTISRAKLVPPEARSSSQALVIRDVTDEEYIHRLLGDFLANITHEFRTPLAALEASSELMLDNLNHLSQLELKELLVSLNLGIIDLQTLIDNLIEAASIEAGRFKISRQPVVFSTIVEDALKVIQPLADKYRLKLVCASRCETSALVLADRRRMVQVLVNLLSNAIKHSPESGQIQIDYYAEGQYLHVEVKDEGHGVPPDKRSILFKRFSHLDSSNDRARQGAGLGLSVVKAIVEAHEGDVGITDTAEGITAFWFTVPLEGKERK
jgi:two-component system sensor histidine kinase ResE